MTHQPVSPVRSVGEALPEGFTIRIRDDVRRLEPTAGGVVLVGGSPLRALRLAPAAAAMLVGESLTVVNADAAAVARRLLDGNLADPTDLLPIDPAELTVVIPVRDRTAQLERCLTALAGLPTIVVDDASHQSAAVRDVAQRHGATLIVLDANRGPAGARNAGLAHVTTPYVAFVDSDVTATPKTLNALAGHFTDPRVALAGPLVRGKARSSRPRWFERYDERASSLALGSRACSVRPGAAVGWLPSACLVARTERLRAPEIDGFAPDLQVGEDVDLVWRLLAAGHVVRYDPGLSADHDVRTTIRDWLGRKVVYGTGSAELGTRHGNAIAPAILSPAMAIAAAAILQRRTWAIPVAGAAVLWGTRSVAGVLPEAPGRTRLAATLAARGLGWAIRQEAALLLRHWWPATLLGAASSRHMRRALATALAVDSIVALAEGAGPDPVTRLFGRRLDDLAYGTGLWLGALRLRDPRCLRPVVRRKIEQNQRPGFARVKRSFEG